MTGLIAAGFLLAATPLLAAVLLTGVSLNRLTEHTERLLQEGVALEQLGARLRVNVNDLERNAQQYRVLGDPALLKLLFERVQETETTLQRIEEQRFLTPVADHILSVRQGLAIIAKTSTDTLHDAESLPLLVDRVRELSPDAEAITALGRAAIDSEVEQLRQARDAARWLLLLSSLALIPFTALLAYGISVTVTRPLKRMSLGIAALGHARYHQPIRIEYPSEMQRLGELLNWLRRKLAQLESDQNLFLRNVSHDLKTPLATLREGTDLLREGSLGLLTPRQTEVAKILSDSATELGVRINKLLSYSAWQEDQRRMDVAWFETRPLVDDVLAMQKLPLARRALSVELELLTPRLYGRRASLRVALDNLLINAVKHAPRETVIDIHADCRNGRCELWVRDRGHGVRDSDKVKIFEPFVRASREDEADITGSGVGLSMVKQTVTVHGGTVGVEDAQPGARFKMEWPCAQPDS